MIVKIASEEWEFEQLFRLNYQTFVEEIPQHSGNDEGRLVDKFHEKNIYLIAIHGEKVIGMMAINDIRPFSIDSKLPDLESMLPPFTKAFEIRLLSVDNDHRGNLVFFKLFSLLNEIIEEKKYDIGLISGILTQQKLYSKIGFVPFGPLVGTGDALFQPMYITYDIFKNNSTVARLATKF
jgi:hypothetical protein